METTYGVGIKNRYELFYDDEEDPSEILRQQQEKAQKTATNNKSKGTKTAPPTKEVKGKVNNEPTAPAKTRSLKPGTDRTVRFSNNAQDEVKETDERRNRRNRDGNRDERRFSDMREGRDNENFRGGRGGGMGGNMRGSRGRGRGRGGFDSRGKREFDRQSGSDKSGVKPVEKREGGGAHNWGTIKDDLEVQLTPLNDENPETGERSGDEVVSDQADVKETEAGINNMKVTNEGSNEMTLDEWKAKQKEKRSKASFNLRKAGEGEDSSQWKKCYMLKKRAEGEEDEDESEDEDEEFIRRGRQKQVVDIKINFADSRRARGRGGRGRGSGRGAIRGETKSPEQSVPKVDDWNDFPSLITA